MRYLADFSELLQRFPSVFQCLTTMNAGKSTTERVAAFDEEARVLIGKYNKFERVQYGYEFPVL